MNLFHIKNYKLKYIKVYTKKILYTFIYFYMSLNFILLKVNKIDNNSLFIITLYIIFIYINKYKYNIIYNRSLYNNDLLTYNKSKEIKNFNWLKFTYNTKYSIVNNFQKLKLDFDYNFWKLLKYIFLQKKNIYYLIFNNTYNNYYFLLLKNINSNTFLVVKVWSVKHFIGYKSSNKLKIKSENIEFSALQVGNYISQTYNLENNIINIIIKTNIYLKNNLKALKGLNDSVYFNNNETLLKYLNTTSHNGLRKKKIRRL